MRSQSRWEVQRWHKKYTAKPSSCPCYFETPNPQFYLPLNSKYIWIHNRNSCEFSLKVSLAVSRNSPASSTTWIRFTSKAFECQGSFFLVTHLFVQGSFWGAEGRTPFWFHLHLWNPCSDKRFVQLSLSTWSVWYLIHGNNNFITFEISVIEKEWIGMLEIQNTNHIFTAYPITLFYLVSIFICKEQ